MPINRPNAPIRSHLRGNIITAAKISSACQTFIGQGASAKTFRSSRCRLASCSSACCRAMLSLRAARSNALIRFSNIRSRQSESSQPPRMNSASSAARLTTAPLSRSVG